MKFIIGLQMILVICCCKQIPLYLAVSLDDLDNIQNLMLRFCLKHLQHIYQIDHSISIYQDIQYVQNMIRQGISNDQKWKVPSSYHVTALYIGQNATQIQTPFYETFIPGMQVPISFEAFTYVPNKIMTAVINLDSTDVLIQNKYPHVTLLLDEWNAVDSNYVLQALFDGPLNELYPLQNDHLRLRNWFKLNVKNQSVQVWISKIPYDESILTGTEKEMNE